VQERTEKHFEEATEKERAKEMVKKSELEE
jgi:hypothetical protein